MAIDISGLQKYTQLYPEIIGKLTNKETALGLFVPHTGFNPGPVRLRLFEAEGTLGNCCVTPDANSTFTEIETEVSCIMSGNEFCIEELAQHFTDLQFRYTTGRESAGSLEELIMNQELSAVAKSIDKLIFHGDVDKADENLNKIDGLLKLARTKGAHQVAINSGNIYMAMQAIVSAIPYEVYDMERVAVMVGRDVYNKYKQAWVGMNQFHYNPGNSSFDTIEIPGTDVQVIPVRGLDGTGIAMATSLNNIHWLTNLEDDHMTISWNYSDYHQKYFWRLKFLLGLTFGFYDYVVVADIDSSVLSAGISYDVNRFNNPLMVSNDGTFA